MADETIICWNCHAAVDEGLPECPTCKAGITPPQADEAYEGWRRGHDGRKAKRLVVATLVGFIAVVLCTFVWLVAVVVPAAVPQNPVIPQWTPPTRSHAVVGFAWGSIASIGIALAMYFSIRGLGRWASGTPETRTPTAVARVVTFLFSCAALAVLTAWAIYLLSNQAWAD